MELVKKLLKGLFFVFLGILGGMLWQLILLPYLAERPETKDLWFVRNWRERKVVLYPKEETTVVENKALTEAVEKVGESLLEVRNGGLTRGSGLILTADGLAVTLAELLPPAESPSFYTSGEEVEGRVMKRDLDKNLALVKLERDNLTTAPFGEAGVVKRGERVFLLKSGKDGVIVKGGIISKKGEDFLYSDIEGQKNLRGSVLFNVEGEVLGINKVGLDQELLTIPVLRVKTFAGL